MNATFELKRAVLIYEDTNSAFCTVNRVHNVAGRAQIGPGVALSRVGLNSLVQKMSGAPSRRQVLPTNVLFADGVRMCWWVPQRIAPIYFKTRCSGLNALSGTRVVWPSCLFVADPEKLSVWALADETRPAATTPLLIAPFFNVYQDGSMCAGNVRLPQTISPCELAEWEQGFYATEFTHTNARGRLTSHRHGHAGLWAEIARRRFERFPVQHLVSAGVIVEMALNKR